MARAATRPEGFSLVELVVVIVIAGILAAVIGTFIAAPVQGFFDQARRAELVDGAQLALTRMGRDLRASLPNSIRVNGAGDTLDLLLTLDGDRYRAEAPGTPDDRLDITTADGRFNTFAPLAGPEPLPAEYDVEGALAIYPLDQPGADPWEPGDGTMTPAGTLRITRVENPAASGRHEWQVSLLLVPDGPGAHRFPFQSPSRRVFLVQGPVTWTCAGGQLLRTDGAGTATIARNVESCAFRYAAGTAQRNAVVHTALVLEQAGERVRLLRQVHVDNTP